MRRPLLLPSALLVTAAAAAAGCAPRSDAASDTSTATAVADSPAAATSTPGAMDSTQAGAPNTLTEAERAAGWTLLFDGSTLQGWRPYNAPGKPVTGWQVVDGTITRAEHGGDIVTDSVYRDFELSLEWKVPPGGNSGVFYRALESKDPIYYSAPEMQVLDDARHVDGKNPLTSAGAAYGLYAPPKGVVKPAGEWNAARVVVRGNAVEHWLNGQKVVSYELGSADWKAKVAASKFNEWKAYGTGQEGRIGLQDHDDRVQFRSIKVRTL
jgi:hypothetical protein